jgi:hypothetical protein
MDLTWSEPPKARGGRGHTNWEDVVDQLLRHPGQSALIGRFSPSVAVHIRAGDYLAFLPENVGRRSPEAREYMAENWEVSSRATDEPGRLDVWIKWKGGRA